MTSSIITGTSSHAQVKRDASTQTDPEVWPGAFWGLARGLRQRDALCDVVISVRDSVSGVMRVPAHSLVLACAGDYFERHLAGRVATTPVSLEHMDITPRSLKSLLDLLYGIGSCETVPDDVIRAAKLLQMDGLFGGALDDVSVRTRDSSESPQHMNVDANESRTSPHRESEITGRTPSPTLPAHEESSAVSDPQQHITRRVNQQQRPCKQPKHTRAIHSCPVCKVEFKNVKHLRKHMRCEHPGSCRPGSAKKHICPICKKGFERPYKLQDHMHIHANNRDFLCPLCGKTYQSQANLYQHLRTHSSGSRAKHTCCECGVEYCSRTRLSEHMKAKHGLGGSGLLCHLCGKAFSWPQSLRKHTLTHQGRTKLKRFQCELCKAKFTTMYGLKRHEEKYCPHDPRKVNVEAMTSVQTARSNSSQQCVVSCVTPMSR